jgi:polar amino acid transport system permease protein
VNLLGPALTAVIGLPLHEAAYAAEVVRGGILSVDAGQTEAAQALVSVPAVHDLLYSVQLVTTRRTRQFYVERHYALGATRVLPPTPFQRLRARLATHLLSLRSLSNY